MRTITSSFGKNIKVSIFGGSHEDKIGVTIEGLPGGFTYADVDEKELQKFMDRRAPGNSPYATSRREPDQPVLFEKQPLTYVIYNKNQRSKDYSKLKDTPRPGHADYTAHIRYKDSVNMAGGGPFSGRMTAPLCIAGGIAKQILAEQGIEIHAELVSAGGKTGEDMYSGILEAKEQGDSVGGIVHVTASGVPAGIGGAMYDGLESYIAPIVFGIPAVKGLSFGNGFASSSLRGSENNDPFVIKDGKVKTETNNAGGILGGISDGMDIEMDVAFKPTPSISKEQRTVNLRIMKETTITIEGRHDPCVAVRGVPVTEAALALGLLDAMCAKD